MRQLRTLLFIALCGHFLYTCGIPDCVVTLDVGQEIEVEEETDPAWPDVTT